MHDFLATILARKAEEVDARRRRVSIQELQSRCADQERTRGMVSAIQYQIHRGQPAVIADIKRASPSRGMIRANIDPVQIAVSYELGGACCLSVVTDQTFFRGHDGYLILAKGACTLPVLRYEFIVDSYQIHESRAIGADCVLFIAAALTEMQLVEFTGLAMSLGLDVLVEVADIDELERALQTPAPLIGIHAHNDQTSDVSLGPTLSLLPYVPADRIVVAENGPQTKDGIQVMWTEGIRAFLVGEACMDRPEPGQALYELFDLS